MPWECCLTHSFQRGLRGFITVNGYVCWPSFGLWKCISNDITVFHVKVAVIAHVLGLFTFLLRIPYRQSWTKVLRWLISWYVHIWSLISFYGRFIIWAWVGLLPDLVLPLLLQEIFANRCFEVDWVQFKEIFNQSFSMPVSWDFNIYWLLESLWRALVAVRLWYIFLKFHF